MKTTKTNPDPAPDEGVMKCGLPLAGGYKCGIPRRNGRGHDGPCVADIPPNPAPSAPVAACPKCKMVHVPLEPCPCTPPPVCPECGLYPPKHLRTCSQAPVAGDASGDTASAEGAVTPRTDAAIHIARMVNPNRGLGSKVREYVLPYFARTLERECQIKDGRIATLEREARRLREWVMAYCLVKRLGQGAADWDCLPVTEEILREALSGGKEGA